MEHVPEPPMMPSSPHPPTMASKSTYIESPIPYHSDPHKYPEVVPGTGATVVRPGYGYSNPNHEYNPWAAWHGGRPPVQPSRYGPRFWLYFTIVVALVIVIVLASVLGAMASGSIKTSGISSSGQGPTVTVTASAATSGTGSAVIATTSPPLSSSSPAASPRISSAPSSTSSSISTAATTSTSAETSPSQSITMVQTPSGPVKVECPGADGLNFTAPGTSKVFRRQCDVNFAGGDGLLGLQSGTFLSMADCINACARQPDCVAADFNYQPQCWLKQILTEKSYGAGQEFAILWKS